MTQFNRLASVFGANHYHEERRTLIWREVQSFDGEWLRRLVDELIANERQAPLMPQFREAITRERERVYHQEKQQHKQEAENWPEFLPEEEKKTLFEAIRKRISGNMSDADWECVLKIIASIPKMPLKEGA